MAGDAERREPQREVSREQYDGHRQDVERLRDKQRGEELHGAGSAAKNHRFRDFIALVASRAGGAKHRDSRAGGAGHEGGSDNK